MTGKAQEYFYGNYLAICSKLWTSKNKIGCFQTLLCGTFITASGKQRVKRYCLFRVRNFGHSLSMYDCLIYKPTTSTNRGSQQL